MTNQMDERLAHVMSTAPDRRTTVEAVGRDRLWPVATAVAVSAAAGLIALVITASPSPTEEEETAAVGAAATEIAGGLPTHLQQFESRSGTGSYDTGVLQHSARQLEMLEPASQVSAVGSISAAEMIRSDIDAAAAATCWRAPAGRRTAEQMVQDDIDHAVAAGSSNSCE